MTDKPEYRVYRARRGFMSRLLNRGGERFAPAKPKPPASPGTPGTAGKRPPAGPGEPRRPVAPQAGAPLSGPWYQRLDWRRILRWTLVAVVGWVVLSLILFVVSAQIQSSKLPGAVKASLDDGGNMLTSPNNILVLGSDRRPGDNGSSRADTIMLMRFGGGKASRLSIPRDTLVNIPGVGPSKVNAAYAYGGTPLMIKTLKQYLGIEINHVVEINFKNFPKFVDALGGVNMSFDTCTVSHFEGRTPRYGCRGNFRRCRASHQPEHLSGKQALDAVRIRKNTCAPGESDLTRARRQQQFLEAVKHRLLSPFTFPRLPWVSWRAPQAVRSDMGGFSLMSLLFDSEVGGSLEPTILKPIDPGANPLQVSDAEKQADVQRFLDG